jgi:hypothetical protein
MKVTKLKFKWVGRLDSREKILRLFRIVFANGADSTKVGWCSYKLSFAIKPILFDYYRSQFDWELVLLGFRIHLGRSWGGWFS